MSSDSDPEPTGYKSFRSTDFLSSAGMTARDRNDIAPCHSGSEIPGILTIPGISAQNDGVPVLRHPKLFVLYSGGNYILLPVAVLVTTDVW